MWVACKNWGSPGNDFFPGASRSNGPRPHLDSKPGSQFTICRTVRKVVVQTHSVDVRKHGTTPTGSRSSTWRTPEFLPRLQRVGLRRGLFLHGGRCGLREPRRPWALPTQGQPTGVKEWVLQAEWDQELLAGSRATVEVVLMPCCHSISQGSLQAPDTKMTFSFFVFRSISWQPTG